MENLATPAEMVEDIMTNPELQSRISAEAFAGLLVMANMQEKEKTTCYQQVG
ncbi:hypothetical protein [Brevibacillus fortis]|uniref:hypothetical protein n=1 Tax=Brevibacillus fortis TaxID=2126352 RepID=UPI0038FCCA30